MVKFTDDVPVFNWDQLNKKTRILRVIVYDADGLGDPGDYLGSTGQFIMFQGSTPPVVSKTMGVYEDAQGRVIAEVRIDPVDWPPNALYRHECELTDPLGNKVAILQGQINVKHSGFEN